MPRIKVHTASPYSVLVQRGLISRIGQELIALHAPCRVALLADTVSEMLCAEEAEASLTAAGFSVSRIILPPGEQNKSWQTLGEVLERLAALHLTRGDLLLGIGGGVMGDLGGLAAALYLRGVPFVQAPTTLLAAVDASVGGKSAVNLTAGKNLVGAVKQPLAVFCDPDLLADLPAVLVSDGMSEAIKLGVLGAEGVWEQVTSDAPDLEALITACVSCKAALVEQDENDMGARHALNLGHTFGHAIEQHSGYALSHGQAVAAGLAIMTRAAVERGWCDSITAERIYAVLRRWQLPLRYACTAEELMPYVLEDKKRQGDTVVIVVPNKLGYCTLQKAKPQELLELLRLGL